MKITVFTGNQPRHLALIARLGDVADEVFAVQECSTIFPGHVSDFYRKSDVMQTYFSKVIAAEEEVFGGVRFSCPNARTLAIKVGDLNGIAMDRLSGALCSDLYIVFGASYIKGELIEFLVANGAINIHMGVSPYYRGNSCNFWALYDDNIDLVGATIHRLSKGLDSGDILFHALPKPCSIDPFVFGMLAVKAAQNALVESIVAGALPSMATVRQDPLNQIRYTRNADFTDAVAAQYLKQARKPEDVFRLSGSGPDRKLIRPNYF